MQLALGRANIVIECHRVKLVTVIWGAGRFIIKPRGERQRLNAKLRVSLFFHVQLLLFNLIILSTLFCLVKIIYALYSVMAHKSHFWTMLCQSNITVDSEVDYT